MQRNRCINYLLAGYTLLEMLLVIAVVGILATLAISQVKKYSENTRMNKVSTQFQYVFEAAMAYQVKSSQHDWPPNFTVRKPDGELQDFIEKYLPNQNYTSAFGHEFFWIGKKQDEGNPNKLVQVPLFTVYTEITGEKAGAIAKQIAGRLPNAVVVKEAPTIRDPLMPGQPCQPGDRVCYVRAAIPTPAAVSADQGNPYRILGQCDSSGNPLSNPESDAVCTTTYSDDGQKRGYFFSVQAKCPSLSEKSSHSHMTISMSSFYKDQKKDDGYLSALMTFSLDEKGITCEPQQSNNYNTECFTVKPFLVKVLQIPLNKKEKDSAIICGLKDHPDGCDVKFNYIVTCPTNT